MDYVLRFMPAKKKVKEIVEEKKRFPIAYIAGIGGGVVAIGLIGFVVFSGGGGSSYVPPEVRSPEEIERTVTDARNQTATAMLSIYDEFRNGVGYSDISVVTTIRSLRKELRAAYQDADLKMQEELNRIDRALLETERRVTDESLEAITYAEEALGELDVVIENKIDIDALRGTSTAATSTNATSTDETVEGIDNETEFETGTGSEAAIHAETESE